LYRRLFKARVKCPDERVPQRDNVEGQEITEPIGTFI
jgi:hypothetical protein